MNSKVIGIIAVIVIAVIAVGGFFMVNSEEDMPPAEQSDDIIPDDTLEQEDDFGSEEDLNPEGVDFFEGEVTEVDTSNNTLLVSREDGEELTVTYTEETFFEPFMGDIESIEELEVGTRIDGQGMRNEEGVFEAEEIFVLFSEEDQVPEGDEFPVEEEPEFPDEGGDELFLDEE